MTSPGWYHAQGDPVGTQRYWDGSQWQGDAITPAAAPNDIVYYEAAGSQVDLGDVATRISLGETDPTRVYAESPFSISSSSVNVTRRKKLPEGLKNLTILTCVFKAIPVLGIIAGLVSHFSSSALNVRSRSRFDPPGLDYASAATSVILIGIVIVFGGLLIVQARSVIKDQASNLFAIALVLLMLDLLNTVSQLAVTDDFDAGASMLAAVILVLQSLVAVWAGIQAKLQRA